MTEHNKYNQEFLDVWHLLCNKTKEFYESRLFGYDLLCDNEVRELVGSLKAIQRLQKEPLRELEMAKLKEDQNL